MSTETSLNKKEILNIINSALSGSTKKKDICTFPVLLIPIKETYWKCVENIGKRSEETAIFFFKKIGFNGDRTKINIGGYPEGGYPGIFRELYYPPEWVPKFESDEIDIPLSQKRERELRPLFYHVKELGVQRAKKIYRDYKSNLLKEFFNLLKQPYSHIYQQILDLEIETFSIILDLAHCLTENEFEDLIDALFLDPISGFDEFTLQPGAPDIFIFDSESLFWFFAEIKGPNDYLRQSQKNWIRENWERIRGRFLLVELDIIKM